MSTKTSKLVHYHCSKYHHLLHTIMAALTESAKRVTFHPELHTLRTRLQDILYSIEHFHPPAPRPPIIDSSVEFLGTKQHEEQWLQRRHTPGLKKLKEAVRVDYDVLDKVRCTRVDHR